MLVKEAPRTKFGHHYVHADAFAANGAKPAAGIRLGTKCYKLSSPLFWPYMVFHTFSVINRLYLFLLKQENEIAPMKSLYK